jgi:RNA polymerase sigma-70 factor (ECF subfamily)
MTDLFALRRRLFGIAYRILGSIAEAEDVVQSAYVRLEEHRGEVLQNPGGWLATVTSHLAIDRARALKRQREEYVGVWLPEPLVEDSSDPESETTRSDDLALGFLRVLERLAPEERTAMLLHDVFDYTHAEIGAMLDKREEAVRQMVSRARVRVRRDRPRALVDRRKAEDLTERFLSALHEGNVARLRTILATDVVAMADGGGKAYAGLRPVLGLDKVSRMMAGLHDKFWAAADMHRFTVNGLPGFAVFQQGACTTVGAFDFADDCIASIYLVRNPDKLSHVGGM